MAVNQPELPDGEMEPEILILDRGTVGNDARFLHIMASYTYNIQANHFLAHRSVYTHFHIITGFNIENNYFNYSLFQIISNLNPRKLENITNNVKLSTNTVVNTTGRNPKDYQNRTSFLHGGWIYNYLCNQYLPPLKQGVLDTTLCDKVCH